jgi:excisionase family DNA binding protein
MEGHCMTDLTLTLSPASQRALLRALRALDALEPEPEWFTISEVAKLLKVSDQTIRNRINRGDYPGAIRVGRLYRIPAAEVTI